MPDRLPETLTEWLKQYPHIEVVSRDGFTAFRQGISNANPRILQVYDRWHFIQNAKKQLDTFLMSLVPPAIVWKDPLSPKIEVELTKAEREKVERQSQKWAFIQNIQAAHRAGKSISSLAKEYSLSWRTTHKYLHMKDPPTIIRYRAKPIQQYLPLVHQYESQGNTVKDIHLFLKKQGYTGTFSAVRTAVETIRRDRKRQQRAEYLHKVPRNKLARWIWMGDAKLNISEQADLQRCLQTYPPLQSLYQMIQEYRTIIESNNYDAFLYWLRKQLSNKEMPFYQYARRLRSDLEAVKHAFLLPYSNGVLEGQVNRVKVIKRLLYGKASLSLLQKRVLYQL